MFWLVPHLVPSFLLLLAVPLSLGYVPIGNSRSIFDPFVSAESHPRLFFSNYDYDDIKNRIEKDPFSSQSFQTLLPPLQRFLLNSSTIYGKVYESLCRGSVPVNFTEALPIVTTRSFVGFDSKYSFRGIAAFQNMTGEARSIYSLMASYSFVLWIQRNDTIALQKNARAIATAARYHHSIYPGLLAARKLSAIPKYYDNELAFAYDLSYAWMNDTERNVTRSFIAYLTKGVKLNWCESSTKYYFKNDRYCVSSAALFTSSLAIFQEPGFDAATTLSNCLVIREVLQTWGSYAEGSTQYGLAGQLWSMDSAALGLLALSRANICGNMFDPKVTNLVSTIFQWVYSSAPWLKGFGTAVDDGVYTSGRGNVALLNVFKYIYPQDPIFDLCLVNNRKIPFFGQQALLMSAIGMSPNTSVTLASAFQQAKLNYTKYFPTKGTATTYSSFHTDAIKLDFESRSNTLYFDAVHSSRNHFQLTSHGIFWFGCSGAWHNERHATIFVDGKPQTGNALDGTNGTTVLPGKFLSLIDTDNLTVFIGDAVETYRNPGFNRNVDLYSTGSSNDPSYPVTSQNLTYRHFFLDRGFWMPNNLTFYDTKFRLRNVKMDPFERALRTVALVRGKRPFVIVADSLRKDSLNHTFEWSAATINSDLSIDTSMSTINSTNRVILYRTSSGTGIGSPRLLVHLFSASGCLERPIVMESFVRGTLTTRRLRITRFGCNEPNFQVMFYPFRKGDPIPSVWRNLDFDDGYYIRFSDFETFIRFEMSAMNQAFQIIRNDSVKAPITTTSSTTVKPFSTMTSKRSESQTATNTKSRSSSTTVSSTFLGFNSSKVMVDSVSTTIATTDTESSYMAWPSGTSNFLTSTNYFDEIYTTLDISSMAQSFTSLSDAKTRTLSETTSFSDTSTLIENTSTIKTSTLSDSENTSTIKTSTLSETTYLSETSTLIETTSIIETSTLSDSDSTIKTSTLSDTTYLIETSTLIETTSISETSTLIETTSIIETRTLSDSETTSTIETRTLSETAKTFSIYDGLTDFVSNAITKSVSQTTFSDSQLTSLSETTPIDTTVTSYSSIVKSVSSIIDESSSRDDFTITTLNFDFTITIPEFHTDTIRQSSRTDNSDIEVTTTNLIVTKESLSVFETPIKSSRANSYTDSSTISDSSTFFDSSTYFDSLTTIHHKTTNTLQESHSTTHSLVETSNAAISTTTQSTLNVDLKSSFTLSTVTRTIHETESKISSSINVTKIISSLTLSLPSSIEISSLTSSLISSSSTSSLISSSSTSSLTSSLTFSLNDESSTSSSVTTRILVSTIVSTLVLGSSLYVYRRQSRKRQRISPTMTFSNNASIDTLNNNNNNNNNSFWNLFRGNGNRNKVVPLGVTSSYEMLLKNARSGETLNSGQEMWGQKSKDSLNNSKDRLNDAKLGDLITKSEEILNILHHKPLPKSDLESSHDQLPNQV